MCDPECIFKRICFIVLPMFLLIGNVLYRFFKREWNTLKRVQKYSFDWLLIILFICYVLLVFLDGHHDMMQSSNSTAGFSSNETSQNGQNLHASEIGKFILLWFVWFMNLSRFLVTCFYGKFAWHSHWIIETLMMVSGKLQTKDFSPCSYPKK